MKEAGIILYLPETSRKIVFLTLPETWEESFLLHFYISWIVLPSKNGSEMVVSLYLVCGGGGQIEITDLMMLKSA